MNQPSIEWRLTGCACASDFFFSFLIIQYKILTVRTLALIDIKRENGVKSSFVIRNFFPITFLIACLDRLNFFSKLGFQLLQRPNRFWAGGGQGGGSSTGKPGCYWTLFTPTGKNWALWNSPWLFSSKRGPAGQWKSRLWEFNQTFSCDRNQCRNQNTSFSLKYVL